MKPSFSTSIMLACLGSLCPAWCLGADPGPLKSENQQPWLIDSQVDWEEHTAGSEGLEVVDGTVGPQGKQATIKSVLKRFDAKTSLKSIKLKQIPDWLNWEPTPNIGPSNLNDAPVFLQIGPDNYWMFGRYSKEKWKIKAKAKAKGSGKANGKNKGKSKRIEEPAVKPAEKFVPQAATLEGFDIPLKTTPFENQFDAPGAEQPALGGYHAWQSKDMVNWVHHGSVSNAAGKWMTTAEYANGKAYLYYDFPNDQDPHVYVDSDLFDGVPGENKGMAYLDPSHGSDCAIIRDLNGQFNLILEDWTPINASKHAWDSPLAARAVSETGVSDFIAKPAPVDERAKNTGKIGTYKHPHWTKENPERFKTNVAEYEIHEPEQNAYGDWAAISIGGQYYLFGDYDPAKSKNMSVGWFTSDSLDKQFRWCGSVGQGHPDPDVMFAEGKFYLATQQPKDFVSPGPWVEDVQVRVGVDTDNDQQIDQWTDWTKVTEKYDYIEGFSKQVAREDAELDLTGLPAGFGVQFEIKLTDATENESKPVLDSVELTFGD